MNSRQFTHPVKQFSLISTGRYVHFRGRNNREALFLGQSKPSTSGTIKVIALSYLQLEHGLDGTVLTSLGKPLWLKWKRGLFVMRSSTTKSRQRKAQR